MSRETAKNSSFLAIKKNGGLPPLSLVLNGTLFYFKFPDRRFWYFYNSFSTFFLLNHLNILFPPPPIFGLKEPYFLRNISTNQLKDKNFADQQHNLKVHLNISICWLIYWLIDNEEKKFLGRSSLIFEISPKKQKKSGNVTWIIWSNSCSNPNVHFKRGFVNWEENGTDCKYVIYM